MRRPSALRRGGAFFGFPLWGKLSPQVTDEGEPAGHSPLIRRASAPPSPQGGRLLRRGGVTPPYIAMTPLRGRGGARPARGQMATRKLRVNRVYGFPLRGKLSPQVTDEGEPAGRLPLIRRAGAPPSPQGGRLLRRGGVTPPYIAMTPLHGRGGARPARDLTATVILRVGL